MIAGEDGVSYHEYNGAIPAELDTLVKSAKAILKKRIRYSAASRTGRDLVLVDKYQFLWDHTRSQRQYDDLIAAINKVACLSDGLVEYEDTLPHEKRLAEGQQKLTKR